MRSKKMFAYQYKRLNVSQVKGRAVTEPRHLALPGILPGHILYLINSVSGTTLLYFRLLSIPITDMLTDRYLCITQRIRCLKYPSPVSSLAAPGSRAAAAHIFVFIPTSYFPTS